MNEKLTREEIEELVDYIELAEESYWSVLWAEMADESEQYEDAYRAIRAEEHEGIFS